MKETEIKTIPRIKVIISGDKVERFEYSIPKNKPVYSSIPKTKIIDITEDKQERRYRELRTRIVRLANCNQDIRKFLTLTIHDKNITLSQGNKYFKRFIRRLSKIKQDLKYIAVPEFQERGAVHYHILINLPYTPAKQLEQLWGLGFIKVRAVKNEEDLAKYISKYVSSDIQGIKFYYQKKFFCSHNLNRPTTLLDEEAEEYIRLREFNLQLLFQNSVNIFSGKMTIWIYHLIKTIRLKMNEFRNFVEVLNSSFSQGENEEAGCNISP